MILLNYILVSYNKAIQFNPKFVAAWYNKGVLLSYLGR